MKRVLASFLSLALLAGCSTATSGRSAIAPVDTAKPTITPTSSRTVTANNYDDAPSNITRNANANGNSAFNFVPPTPGSFTGTEVSAKIESLRRDLSNLQNSVQSNAEMFRQVRADTEKQSQTYHGILAAVSARLQVGTTPGNPILVQQWNEAQAQLDKVNESIGRLNNISTRVASDSTLAGYLLDAARASYSLSGAVDEDHRQLRILEDDVNRTIVGIDRLLKELSDDVSRQTAYLATERGNLTAMSLAVKNGEMYGTSLSNRGYTAVPPALAPSMGKPLMSSGSLQAISDDASRALVVIRFDRPNVSYERALYSAMSKALERRPDASFSIVAISPGRGNPAAQALGANNARKYADQVYRSLTDMGLPPSRITLTEQQSATVENNEVRVFVR